MENPNCWTRATHIIEECLSQEAKNANLPIEEQPIGFSLAYQIELKLREAGLINEPEPAGAPAQQGVTLEELKALAEDGLLVTFDKDHRFSFSRVVNLMAEFAEHMLLGRGTREKNTSLRDQLAIIDAIANAIERDK